MNDLLHAANEANEIWTHPQFLVADVCKITGATPKAIEHLLSTKRNVLRLDGPYANPGTGRRRVFTGGQVLMIAVVFHMSRIGFPQRHSQTLAEMVRRRAIFRSGPQTSAGLTILTYPTQDGEDWAFVNTYEDEAPRTVPVAVMALQADILIDQVEAQLKATVAGEELPDFSIPEPELEPDYYSPKENFFRNWVKSKGGRWVYAGLTAKETDELLRYQGFALSGDDLVDVEAVDMTDKQRARYLKLLEKHEAARLDIMSGGGDG